VTRPAPDQIRDFGFEPDESPYHFAVVIGRGEEALVRIEERFELDSKATLGLRAPNAKVVLDAYRWSRIADATRAEFNVRLQAHGQRAAAWRERETLLAPHLGKELTLLAWAVEDADPTVIPNMIANWHGLAPEERWWLYTTVNATSGHPEHGRDRGWRKAIKIALAENPSTAATPGALLTEHDAKLPDAPRRRRVHRREGGSPQRNGDQLTLLGEDRP
jgi:hypothetical protein